MPGLMDALASSTAMTPPGAAAAPSMMQGSGMTMGGGESGEPEPNVTPEEQAQYDAFVKNAMRFMYTPDGKPLPDLMKRVKAGEPVEALAQAVVWVVTMVESSAKKQGQEIPDDVLYHAAAEILEQLVDLVEGTGYHDFSEEDMSRAWQAAMELYGQTNQSEGPRAEEAAGEIKELADAENDGTANSMIPGFDQLPAYMQKMQGAPEGEAPPEEEEPM